MPNAMQVDLFLHGEPKIEVKSGDKYLAIDIGTYPNRVTIFLDPGEMAKWKYNTTVAVDKYLNKIRLGENKNDNS